jgi:hypothetical protein
MVSNKVNDKKSILKIDKKSIKNRFCGGWVSISKKTIVCQKWNFFIKFSGQFRDLDKIPQNIVKFQSFGTLFSTFGAKHPKFKESFEQKLFLDIILKS